MKKIYAFWLAVLIEYRWFWIMHYRKKGNYLLEHGEALSSDRLIKLTKKIDHHGIIAFRLQDQYEALEGRVAEMKSAARPFMRRPKEYVADRLWKNKRLGKEKGIAKQTLG